MENTHFPTLRKTNLNIKHVRKYAYERIKYLREQRSLAQQVQGQQRENEAGTSLTTRSGRLVRISPKPHVLPPLSKKTGAIRKHQTQQQQHQRRRTSRAPRTSNSPEATSALNRYRNEEFQRQLLAHPYTDVERVAIIDKKMQSNNRSNETKPLTTQPNSAQTPAKVQAMYQVNRKVLTHDVVIKQTGYAARDKSIPSGLQSCWRNCSFLSLFTGIIPILQWLPKYSPKRDLMGDIIAGVTVAIMNIPHGMAYGLLAGVTPSNGLYMAIFPVLVYMVLGTSRHISIGTFAVASMMTLKVVQTYATVESSPAAAAVNATVANATTTNSVPVTEIITPLEVVTSLAFTVGIVNLFMGFLRLGTLASLLSDALVSGFTTGAAFHVASSQLKDILGVSVPRHKGAFKIIYTVIDVCKAVPQTNLAAFVFCVCIMIFMTICNECLKPCLRKCCRFPFPGELIAVLGGTIISRLLDMHNRFGVFLVGDIPSKLPMPELPRMDLVPLVAVDSLAIAIVTYSIIMSMGLTFAKKHSYEIRANQELFAMGVGNVVCGCFSCIPMACSLSRSVIQDQTGGTSQLASLVSAGLVVITVLWAGPFFSDLPRCVLSGVILVALKPMFMQVKDLKKFSKQGKLEMLTWIVTFLGVVVIDIDIGLFIGIAVSLLTLYIKGLKPYSTLLGFIPEAQAIYVDINQHRNAIEVPETKIFRYCGSLNFATKIFFRRALYELLGVDKKRTYGSPPPAKQTNGKAAPNGEAARLNGFHYLILDFSMLGHIDVAGCNTLSDINKDMTARGVRLFLACPTDRVYDTLVHSMALGEGPFEVFPTLHDTVEYANACRTA